MTIIHDIQNNIYDNNFNDFINNILIIDNIPDTNQIFTILCNLDKSIWLEYAFPRFKFNVDENILLHNFINIINKKSNIYTFRKISVFINTFHIHKKYIHILLDKMKEFFSYQKNNWTNKQPNTFTSETIIIRILDLLKYTKTIDYYKTKFILENIAHLYSYERNRNTTQIIKEFFKTVNISEYNYI